MQQEHLQNNRTPGPALISDQYASIYFFYFLDVSVYISKNMWNEMISTKEKKRKIWTIQERI